MLELIFLLTFLSVILLLFPILKYCFNKKNSISRLDRYISIEYIKQERKRDSKKQYRIGLDIIARTIAGMRFMDGYKRKVQLQLVRAHVLLKAEEYITICIILFFVLALIAFVLSGELANALLAGVLGWFVPSIFLKSRIKKRVKDLNNQLGDAIVLISNSLKAGYSFFQAVDIVSKEMTGPIADEFALLQKEINLGLSTEKALENLVKRVTSDTLELVVTAVLIQKQVGGNLAEVLDNISSTIRERVKIKGEVKTITAQGRMSGLIISLLPPGLGVMIFLINPEHIGVLFKEPIGLGIVVFSIFMELIGIYFINRIVKIEV